MPTPQDKDKANRNTYICPTPGIKYTTIPYEDNQLVELNVWNDKVYLISIFGTIKFLNIDSKNIFTLLLCMANFIRNRNLKYNIENNISQLNGFG